MSVVSIREATSSDVDTIYELIMAIARHHGQESYVLTDKETLLKDGFCDDAAFGVLLAECDGDVAGYCSYTWNYSIWLGIRYMGIDDVYVWERFRGQNIGEALMLEAKEVCLQRNVKRIRWEVEQDNHGAIRFYQRLGAKLDLKGIFRWDI